MAREGEVWFEGDGGAEIEGVKERRITEEREWESSWSWEERERMAVAKLE